MVPYIPIFRACTSLRSVSRLHAHLIVSGLHEDPFASTKLIELYSQMGCIQSSRLIFYTFPAPDSFMWGVMIKCHVWNDLFGEAIALYHNMLESLSELNNFIFPSVLRACSAIKDLRMGENVHSRILKSGFGLDNVIETSMLSMYGENGSLCNARKVFDVMPVRDVVSWSALISNYVRNGQDSEGLRLFREMVREGVDIDSVTMLSVAEACGEMGLWSAGKSSHAYVMRRNIGSNYESLGSSLIAMYGKCGDLLTAERLLFHGAYQSVTSWTALISCYNQNGYYSKALRMFVEMQCCEVGSNSVTLMNVVCCCARLGWVREGKSVHGYAIRMNINIDRDFLRSSLVDLYANSGNLGYGRRLFTATQEEHVVSWNILIAGYAREGMAQEALTLFAQMLIEGILPDSFALASALSACGLIGLLELGSQIHALIIKTSQLPSDFVENALIDMYSKCGLITSASRMFHDCQQRSIVTWNSMLCGFSQNGYSKEALSLFDEMYSKYLEMDGVTFLSVIQACANLGFVDRGKWIHHKLITLGLTRDMYIDTALTNMYARCGDLQMARRVFDNMTERSVVSWSSLIGGYAIHGRIDDSISFFDRMIESGVKPNDVTFMNILSACSHAGYVEKGKSYFNALVNDFGIQPNFEHYACLVDMLSRAGDLKAAYEVMKFISPPPDASIWGALVNGCRIHHRVDFFNSIKSDLMNMQANDSGYYTLLSNVYAEAGKLKESMMVKAKMRSLAVKKVHGCSMIHIEQHV